MADVPNWSVLKPELCDWVAGLMGIDASSVAFEKQPREAFDEGPTVELRLSAYQGVGQDGTRYEFDAAAPNGQQMVPTVTGQRQFTLGVQVQSLDNEDDADAWSYASRLIDRLCRPTSLNKLRKAGLALIEASPPLDLGETLDGHVRSRMQVDLLMGACMAIEDEPTTTIDRAVINVCLTDPDDNPVIQGEATYG